MSATASRVDATLTTYARGVQQDRTKSLAEYLAPSVPVASASGKYKSFSDKNAFQLLNTARAVGGPAARLEFEADDPEYSCKPNSLEIGVDDHERDEAGDADTMMEQAKVDTLLSSALTNHENGVMGRINAALSAVGGVGVWSNASNDPVDEIDQQILAITTDIGMMPNRIVFGLGAWMAFRKHTKVINRQPGATLQGLTTGQASALFLNPEIEVRVGVMSKDSAKFGAAKSASQIIGLEVYVFYNSPAPTQFDPSFAKTFRVREGIDRVYRYRDDRHRSDVLCLDWTVDTKIVSTIAARRISIT